MDRQIILLFLFLRVLQASAQEAMTNWQGEQVNVSDLTQAPFTVFIFMSPECPLCENYSATLRELRTQFSETSVAFVGIFSGQWYRKEEITRFLARYQPPIDPVLDPGYVLRDRFEARVTPEAVLVDAEGQVLYQGKIDNWIVSLGRKRTVVNQFYLRDALHAVLEGEEPQISQTEAVGCFIE